MSEVVKITKAAFKSAQVNLALEAMATLRPLVRGFFYVKNPVGQAFQRYFDQPLQGTVKVKGRKAALKLEIPRLWCVAVDPANGRRVKGAGSKFLKALQAKHVDPKNAIPLLSELLTYFGAKLITSQDQKYEGALMAQIVNHLESEGGLTLESLAVGDTSHDRTAITTKRDRQLRYLEVLVDAGIAPDNSRSGGSNLPPTVPLL
jgi:hypothetical protein